MRPEQMVGWAPYSRRAFAALRELPAQVAEEQVWAALSTVGASEWVVQLPDRLDTTVGAGGEDVTDAQMQQIALARLVLADPLVVILDEATAYLDPRSARHLEHALTSVLADRTVIAIAHRLHAARDADRIAVMEHGRIIELGSHDTLLERGGAYARLWST